MKNYLDLYENILTNPKAEKIEYNISKKYVETLTEVFGIKEFIANFYDVNKTEFDMNYKKGQLTLEDQNGGIDIRYMIIGNSGSREVNERIGEHGEGFKVGALTLVRLGYKVLIETVGYTIVFGIENSPLLNTDVMFAKYIKTDKKKGTTLFTQCTKKGFEKAKEMFLHLSSYSKITPSILEMEGKQKNIYLNGLSHVKRKSLFAYNISKKELVSNRDRNFINPAILKEEVSSLYEGLEDESSIKQIMNKIMEEPCQFNKMYEATVFPTLQLSAHQKMLYCDALCSDLEEDVYYVETNTKPKSDKNLQYIEVDAKLFEFLKLIDAPVIDSEKASVNQTLKTFEYDEDSLPSSIELEEGTIEMFLTDSNGIFTDTSVSFDFLKTYGGYRFKEADLEATLASMKTSNKVHRSFTSLNVYKTTIANAALLACHHFDVCITDAHAKYVFQRVAKEKKITISVLKKDLGNTRPYSISVSKDVGFNSCIKDEQSTYFYLGCLRYKKIHALYSYQYKKGDLAHFNGYVSNLQNVSMKEAVKELVSKKATEFFTRYISQLEFKSLEEHLFLADLKITKAKTNTFMKLFEEKYPNAVLTSEKQYDVLVKDRFNMTVLEIEDPNTKTFLLSTGIVDSYTYFLNKQEEGLTTIPLNKEMNRAIELVQDMISEDALLDVQLSPVLPNKVKSLHQDGTIYISQEASVLPMYLATLIYYEYVQMQTGFQKKTHKIESVLTHNILSPQ